MKFLFFSLNSPGHINAALGLADRLLERQHRTTFLTIGPMMDSQVERRGHHVMCIEDQGPNRTLLGAFKWNYIVEQSKHTFLLPPVEGILQSFPYAKEAMKSEIKNNNERIKKLLNQIDPDVIVVDFYFIAPCVVAGHRPWVRLYSANPLSLSRSPSLPPHHAGHSIPKEVQELAKVGRYDEIKRPQEWIEHEKKVSEVSAPLMAEWNDYLISCGCEPLEPGKQAHDSSYLNIYMFPACLDYDKIRPDMKRWIRADSLLRLPQGKWEVPEYLDSKSDLGGLIYLSMGSLASSDVDLMKRLVDILAKSKNRFIVSTGANGDKYKLHDNMWGKKYLPQDLILQKVDMAIIHGGNNSLVECFYFGCPVIIMPVFSDQRDNAQRVHDEELGVSLDPYRCTEYELLSAVNSVMSNGQLRNRMKEIGASMRARDDGLRICRLLENLAKNKMIDQKEIDVYKGEFV